MGIAAIQARLLALTNRQPNVGAEQQVINRKKTEIDRQQEVLNKNTEFKEEPSPIDTLMHTEDKSIISKDAKKLANNYSKNTEVNEEKVENKIFEKEEKPVAQKLTGYQKLMANNIKKTYNTFAK